MVLSPSVLVAVLRARAAPVTPQAVNELARRAVSCKDGNDIFDGKWITRYTEKGLLLNHTGGRGGLIGRASASRSNGFHDQRFEFRLEQKKNL